MLLDQTQRLKLRNIMESPDFAVVFQFLDAYKAILEKANTLGDTEFETVKLSAQREYQMILIDEIKRLMQEEAAATGVNDDK